jgi:ADP-heptose:LPS heptosyltransferase
VEGVKSVVPFGAPLPAFGCQAPLLSLPYIFGTTLQTIPALIPYVSISADYLEKWAALIPSHLATIRVGLVWAGSSIHRNDSLRSLTISVLEPLAGGLEHVTLFSLQIGDAKHQLKRSSLAARAIDLSDKIENFADTAGLVEQLDLVITIDSAVAHLAGALGKQVYLLVPFAPDWRWLLERSDSPWYPTLQIVRQKQPGEWGEVITRVRAALEMQQKIL